MCGYYVFDSSAWIEYFLGTSLGKQVDDLLRGDIDVIVPNIVLAEVTSKLIRLEVDEKKAVSYLTCCLPAVEDKEYFVEAGKLHAEKRLVDKNYPMADAIIFVLASKLNAKIVTKDRHLAGKNTILLE